MITIIKGLIREWIWKLINYKKTNSEIFDNIYRTGKWGFDNSGSASSGSGTLDDNLSTSYIQLVKSRYSGCNYKRMIDLGCGDFRIGSQLVDVCQSYMACDASPHIIDLNRKKYSNLDVDFKVLDIANSAIPDGEVVLIRQVLQHLSNEQISRFVNQINNNDKMKVLLVTEHLPFHNFKPNINKPVGHSIRILRNSGVVLHERPFNLKCKKMNVLLTLEKSSAGKEGVIQTTEYLF